MGHQMENGIVVFGLTLFVLEILKVHDFKSTMSEILVVVLFHRLPLLPE